MNQLYRHFDIYGNLLYVGVSLSAVGRLAQHKRHAKWYSEIQTMTVENFSSRTELLNAERIAIINEKPLHNKQYNSNNNIAVKKSHMYHEIEKLRTDLIKLLWYLLNEKVKNDELYNDEIDAFDEHYEYMSTVIKNIEDEVIYLDSVDGEVTMCLNYYFDCDKGLTVFIHESKLEYILQYINYLESLEVELESIGVYLYIVIISNSDDGFYEIEAGCVSLSHENKYEMNMLNDYVSSLKYKKQYIIDMSIDKHRRYKPYLNKLIRGEVIEDGKKEKEETV